MDTPSTPQELHALWSHRSGYFNADAMVMDELVGMYHGIMPQAYLDLFHPEQRKHIINMVRLAWDDLASLAGKEFPLYVPPDNDTPTARERAEKQEKIGYGYNRAGRLAGSVSMSALMKVLTWWLVGTGNAVAMVLPDYTHHNPFFTFRDPRTHYPPAGWSPYTQAAPEDALFVYQMTLGELKARYPDKADDLNRLYRFQSGPGGKNKKIDDTSAFWLGEYYHKDAWYLAVMDTRFPVVLAASETGDPGHPGVMPVVSFNLYSPNGAKGRSIFADQLSLQAALSRMLSQRLDFFDRTLYPVVFHTPLAGKTIRIGPYATNEYDTTSSSTPPRLDVVAPAHPVDADQAIQLVANLSRVLNRNPEAMQGGGPANSAKAIEELKQGVNGTVRDQLWPPLLEGLPVLYEKAAYMDQNLWGDETKSSTGKQKNAAFRVTYTPNKDLKGRCADWEAQPGIGLAGYQGSLELMQLYGAHMIALDDVLEQGDWTMEPQATKRRIQLDRAEESMWADLNQKAATGILQPGAWAKLRRMVEEGMDLFDAIEQLEEAGQLTAQPQAPPAIPGGPGGAPGGGVPAGSLGSQPAASMLPAPTLQALRGGPNRKPGVGGY